MGDADRRAVVDRFADTPRLLAAAVAGIEVAGRAGDAGRSVPAGTWGPRETVRHLIAVEREVWWSRLDSIRTEDEPHWSWTEPGQEPGLDRATLTDLTARFADNRARSVKILDAFADADWIRTGIHATYGRLDVVGLLGIALDHDAEHLRSLEPA